MAISQNGIVTWSEIKTLTNYPHSYTNANQCPKYSDVGGVVNVDSIGHPITTTSSDKDKLVLGYMIFPSYRSTDSSGNLTNTYNLNWSPTYCYHQIKNSAKIPITFINGKVDFTVAYSTGSASSKTVTKQFTMYLGSSTQYSSSDPSRGAQITSMSSGSDSYKFTMYNFPNIFYYGRELAGYGYIKGITFNTAYIKLYGRTAFYSRNVTLNIYKAVGPNAITGQVMASGTNWKNTLMHSISVPLNSTTSITKSVTINTSSLADFWNIRFLINIPVESSGSGS